MKIIEPYVHGCSSCIYAGWAEVDGRLGNLYFCPDARDPKHPGSIIFRYGNEAHEYAVWPVGYVEKGGISINEPEAREAVAKET